jgi:SAM-dependent methyltransferase
MTHPGKEWYENSAIYEEVEWNVPSVAVLGKRWEFARALKNVNQSKAKVFDIGCGRGDFLKLAEAHGFQAYGIDLNDALIKVAKETFGLKNVESSTIEDYLKKHPSLRFDVVTAFEVLEHLPNPYEFIGECYRLLGEGGKLVLSVPGYDRFPHWVNNAVDLPPHHLTLWSGSALKTLLERHKFKNIVIERKPLLLNDLMYHAVRRFPFSQKPGWLSKGIRGMLKLSLVPFWLFGRTWPNAGGFTYLAVGTK